MSDASEWDGWNSWGLTELYLISTLFLHCGWLTHSMVISRQLNFLHLAGLCQSEHSERVRWKYCSKRAWRSILFFFKSLYLGMIDSKVEAIRLSITWLRNYGNSCLLHYAGKKWVRRPAQIQERRPHKNVNNKRLFHSEVTSGA